MSRPTRKHLLPVRELVQANRSAVLSVAEKIQALLETPCTFEVLLQQIFRDYGLTMNFEQYVLIGSTCAPTCPG